MRATLLLLPVFAASCVFPQHKATKVVEITLPAKDVARIDCESHNGDITVKGDAAVTEIGVRVEMTAYGHSQAEADAKLHLLELGHEQAADTLKLFGKYPAKEFPTRGPGFQFTLKVPPKVALQLLSHNGDLDVRGTEGEAKLETHNGDIDGNLHGARVAASSHNGDIDLDMKGTGRLDGKVSTHNGDIDLTVADGLGARIDASTHNGRVKRPERMTDASSSKRRLTGKLGDGSGQLVIETHNGDVTLR